VRRVARTRTPRPFPRRIRAHGSTYGSNLAARRCAHLSTTLRSRVWSSRMFSPPTRLDQSGSLWEIDPLESFRISKFSLLATDDLCQPNLLPFALGGCFKMTMKYDRWSDSATLTGGMKNISYISSRLLVRAALPLFLFLRATAAWAQSETNQPPLPPPGRLVAEGGWRLHIK